MLCLSFSHHFVNDEKIFYHSLITSLDNFPLSTIKVINTLSESAIALVMNYDWPGNVRELENVLERSFLFSTSPIIYELLLPHTNKDKLKNVGQQAHLTLKQAEALLIKQELTRFIGNVGDVAKSWGITPRAIHQKIKLHNIDLNHFRAQ